MKVEMVKLIKWGVCSLNFNFYLVPLSLGRAFIVFGLRFFFRLDSGHDNFCQ